MQTPTSSFGLIERFKRGDQSAFTQLFEKYRGRLAVLIHYKLSPELRASMEVDDLLQETFLAAAEDIQRFDYRAPGSFYAWLARIAGNVVADAARYQGRQKRHPEELVRFRSASNPGGPEPADSETPSRILAIKENMGRLRAKLDELPEEMQRVILLAKFEGLTTREVAERLGKSREATALLLHRALKRFRQAAGEEPRQ